jgi:hypothetical protein
LVNGARLARNRRARRRLESRALARAGRQRPHPVHRRQGGPGHRRLRRQRHADLQGPPLPALDRRLSYGFTFGASQTAFRGTVTNIRRPQDVEGVYAAGSAGAALGRGAQAIVLTNQNGAVLTLTGRSVGVIVSADLNGLALSLQR